MTFDAMAAAVDWLDAYRAGDIETILGMYRDDAVTECGCDRVSVVGRNALRAYWERRVKNYPASELDDLTASEDGATISYVTAKGQVAAVLKFDDQGRITVLRCGPAKA